MHSLARTFAAKLRQDLISNESLEVFGETLRYNTIFSGKLEAGECVTSEEFIPGSFDKHVNNTGRICGADSPLTKKAECLAHYSYVTSNKELMLVDIQDCGSKLFHPEIASKELTSGTEVLFSTGNLSKHAISNFVASHKCDIYCELLVTSA